jgi:hypothetical protein
MIDMPEVGLLVFSPENQDLVLDSLGYSVSKNGYLLKDDETVRCACCDRALRPSNFGGALPGSLIPYCDNSACLVEYVQQYVED